MERKPEGAAVQEGHDNFDSYKPAGKVSPIPFTACLVLTYQLRGKKAIVTGGDSGIGRAAAVMYGMEGADVSYSLPST